MRMALILWVIFIESSGKRVVERWATPSRCPIHCKFSSMIFPNRRMPTGGMFGRPPPIADAAFQVWPKNSELLRQINLAEQRGIRPRHLLAFGRGDDFGANARQHLLHL